MELSPPRAVNEVQSLNGKIAALNKFVSRATDKCLPFFRTLKRSFEWKNECQKAFEDLKVYLSALPLLSPSMPGEELFMYLAVSSTAISAALIREEDKVQRPMYFISRALRGAEERYPQMEKLTFALVTAARKLKPYFQAHTINVLTDKPLRKAMSSPEVAERMALWAIELSEFDIRYQSRAAMKGQILADFIAEFTIIKDRGAEETPMWRVHTDGSSNKHARGAGVILHTPEGDKIECMICLDFSTPNNEAEYKALISGLDLAIAAGAKSMVVYSDSQVVTNQVNGSYKCKNERMKRYGILRVLVSNNEKQFDNDTFRDFCSQLRIKNHYSSPAHPQANGQAYRTTARTPTGEMPFRLAYVSEAIIPAEVGLTSYRVENYDKSKNDEQMRLQLDLVDEVRAAAEQRLVRYQDLMAKHYNSKVRHRDIQVGDLVLRRVLGATKDASQGKLGPN
ncbi:uncharacterized protein LOC142620485 [Castanea sativa]|uniref:uncharacterized protein LOC142620485 n=1 Tax=Castanea sativa TaxID=21020 RepID=UPI003F65482D